MQRHSIMVTTFKKSVQELEALLQDLERQQDGQVGSDKTARQWGEDVSNLCNALEKLRRTVSY